MGQEDLNEVMYEDWCKQQEWEWEAGFMPKTWTPERSETVFIKDMTTEHITNCISWLKENRADNPNMPRMVEAFELELKSRE